MEDTSKNSWINKAGPQDVSSQACQKDGLYKDILDGRRGGASDLQYVLRTRSDVPAFKDCQPRSPAVIKQHVLASERVNYRIERICEETGASYSSVLAEASSILDEMAHDISMASIRGFAFALIKIFKALFSRVYVNDEGVQKLRETLAEYPVVLMPSHRSYLDFLLVSYIMYDHDLPLPVIAAAMDFKGMKFFGWLLRKSGAFYIRRSFGSDLLYWAVFTEYVQSQLRNGDYPLEFFVEGTRSRTAKSYQPKIGMLSATLESYFKAEVPDIMFVPISISYERIIEETLYAYELLGIPKPKESASGVWKAKSVLSEDYGSVHFHISEPISIRKFADGKIDRARHALEPRYINNLPAEELKVIRDLSYHILKCQQKHMVISPWSLMATVLMQNADGISVTGLLREVEWLKRQACSLAAYIDWPGNTSADSVLRHYLHLYKHLVTVGDGGIIELRMTSYETKSKVSGVRKQVSDTVLHNAATAVALSTYRNQLLHVFQHTAMVALAVHSCHSNSIHTSELFKKYTFLEAMLKAEFIFAPGESRASFDSAVSALCNSGVLVMHDSKVLVQESINKHTTFLCHMFEPFLMTYWVLCQYLLSLTCDVHGRPLAVKPRVLVLGAQRLSLNLLQDSVVRHYEILSLDILNNGLTALKGMGAMYADRRDQSAYTSPNSSAISNIVRELGQYIEVPCVTIEHYTSSTKPTLIPAKL